MFFALVHRLLPITTTRNHEGAIPKRIFEAALDLDKRDVQLVPDAQELESRKLPSGFIACVRAESLPVPAKCPSWISG
jgi:hypothetical protein